MQHTRLGSLTDPSTSTTESSLVSHETIPEPVLKVISMKASMLEEAPSFGSSGFGSSFSRLKIATDYEFGVESEVSASELIDKHLSENSSIEVLDLGCGNGSILSQLLKKYSKKMKGIGYDLKAPSFLEKDQFVKGDLHDLSLLKKHSFDLILSKATFRFLVDPKAALCEAYERLKPGGILVIDQIFFPGLSGYEKSLVDHLNKLGYPTIVESGKNGCLNLFVIQKTHDQLELPVSYHETKPLSSFGAAQYQPLELEKSKDGLSSEVAIKKLHGLL